MTDDDRAAIEAQCRAHLQTASDSPGDGTEVLAGLYAAVQIVERELLTAGACDGAHLSLVQLQGRRVGAAMVVVVDVEKVEVN